MQLFFVGWKWVVVMLPVRAATLSSSSPSIINLVSIFSLYLGVCFVSICVMNLCLCLYGAYVWSNVP